MPGLDAHQKPPDLLRSLFKTYQTASIASLEADESLIDFTRIAAQSLDRSFRRLENVCVNAVHRVFQDYCRSNEEPDKVQAEDIERFTDDTVIEAYESVDIPGLIVLPGLVPCETQRVILSRTLHRDLSNDQHNTNVNFHHDIIYPQAGGSFFDYDLSNAESISPKDPTTHRPMTTKQFLSKKLRWMTLGGQYDWSEKKYPEQQPPGFPADLSNLLEGLFPRTRPEAAIVNLYSPGDVLSLHRDVSEFCDRGLISLSIGCDAVFLVGRDADSCKASPDHLAVRLRSGDAVYMSGPSRYAWHGVPQVIAGTCPPELQAWPANSISSSGQSDRFDHWHNWMATKRINLNVRQMYE